MIGKFTKPTPCTLPHARITQLDGVLDGPLCQNPPREKFTDCSAQDSQLSPKLENFRLNLHESVIIATLLLFVRKQQAGCEAEIQNGRHDGCLCLLLGVHTSTDEENFIPNFSPTEASGVTLVTPTRLNRTLGTLIC